MKTIATLLLLLPSLACAMDNEGIDTGEMNHDAHAAPHAEHAQWMASGNELEWRDAGEGDLVSWDIDGWYGKDNVRLTLASEGEALDGDVESHELRAGIRMPVAPFWDVNAGARRDLEPDTPSRDWAYIGFSGTAPWFIETDAMLFIGEHGLTQLRLGVSYELLFTQRLILEPELELNAYGKDDPALAIESGLTHLEAGLRLRYEVLRQFAPYVGVSHERDLGDTATRAGKDSETLLVAGLRFWY